MTDDERRELAELYAADDRLRQEHEQWFAQREAAREALVQKTGPEDVLYRQHDNSALAAHAEPETDWSGWEAWMQGHLANARAEIFEELAQGMGEVIATLRKECARTSKPPVPSATRPSPNVTPASAS